MVRMESLFGYRDRLGALAGEGVRFADDRSMLGIAVRFVDAIESAGAGCVVYAESGAAPLVWMCERLARRRKLRVRWIGLKLPREPLPWSSILRGNLDQSASALPLPELRARMAGSLAGRILFLDEYVDTGGTVERLESFFRWLGVRSDFGIVCCHLRPKALIRRLVFSAWPCSESAPCPGEGSYPYENRLDLIGYYYGVSGGTLRRFHVRDLALPIGREDLRELGDFLDSLLDGISSSDALDHARAAARERGMAEFLEEGDLVRFSLRELARDAGAGAMLTGFFDALFEMIGAPWSPLPDDYHLDYLSALEAARQALSRNPMSKAISARFQRICRKLAARAAGICEERRRRWLSEIESLMEQPC